LNEFELAARRLGCRGILRLFALSALLRLAVSLGLFFALLSLPRFGLLSFLISLRFFSFGLCLRIGSFFSNPLFFALFRSLFLPLFFCGLLLSLSLRRRVSTLGFLALCL
jgi:hypothetical protein